MNVIAALTLEDSFVPIANRVLTIAMITSAPQSTVNPPISAVPPANPNTSPRQVDQPLATTAAPTANSSTRSHPMIQAISSPKLA